VELLRRAGKLHGRSRGEESTFVGIRVLPNTMDPANVSTMESGSGGGARRPTLLKSRQKLLDAFSPEREERARLMGTRKACRSVRQVAQRSSGGKDVQRGGDAEDSEELPAKPGRGANRLQIRAK